MSKSRRALYRINLFVLLNLILGGFALVDAQVKMTGDCSPRVSTGSLLDNLKIDSAGKLHFGRLYAACLPLPVRQSKTNYAYHPYDGGKLSATLLDRYGERLGEFVFYGEKFTSVWELPRYETLGGAENVKPVVDSGYYSLRFAIEKNPFQRFDFGVRTIQSKDIYRPGKIYLLEGAWENYSLISFPNVNRYMQMRVWLRDAENAGIEPKIAQYTTELVSLADKKVLARGGGETSSMRLTETWRAFNLSFRRVEGQGEFAPAEILKNEGVYCVNLSVGGKPYGVYFFAVVAGAFMPVADEKGNPLPAKTIPVEMDDKGFSLWRNKS